MADGGLEPELKWECREKLPTNRKVTYIIETGDRERYIPIKFSEDILKEFFKLRIPPYYVSQDADKYINDISEPNKIWELTHLVIIVHTSGTDKNGKHYEQFDIETNIPTGIKKKKRYTPEKIIHKKVNTAVQLRKTLESIFLYEFGLYKNGI